MQRVRSKREVGRRLGESLDGAVGVLFPRWGMRRRQFRKAAQILGQFRAYRGSRKDRTREEWLPGGGSADADLFNELPDLRERSRDLNRNDPHAAGISLTMSSNVVGTGIVPQSRIDAEEIGLDAEEANRLQRLAEKQFHRWMPFADAGNRMDFIEIQQLVDRQILENGEAFVLIQRLDEDSRPYRLALQVIESDRISSPPGMGSDKTIRNGIKIGSEHGEPLGYYIRKTHPGDSSLTAAGERSQFDYVPARDKFGQPNIIHLYHVHRAGQSRGVPFFAPAMDLFKDLASYLEAEVVAARVAACFAVFVKGGEPYSRAVARSSQTNNTNQRVEALEPGMIEYLGENEDIAAFNPQRPGSTFDPFVERVLRTIGSALGLPYELVAKDFSKANYSSIRAALLEARRYFQMRQEWLGRKLCQPVWELWTEEGYLRGQLGFDDYYSFRQAYTAAKWIGPGYRHVDPPKEVKASRDSVAGNLSSLADECAVQGRDWEEVMEQRARERAKEKELGLRDPERPGKLMEDMARGVRSGVPITVAEARSALGLAAEPGENENTLRFNDQDVLAYHIENGVLTINEVRRRLNLGRVEWGDVPVRRQGVAPVDLERKGGEGDEDDSDESRRERDQDEDDR